MAFVYFRNLGSFRKKLLENGLIFLHIKILEQKVEVLTLTRAKSRTFSEQELK